MAHERLVIIGSGPAGLTAAIYAARANLRPVLFEGLPRGTDLPGGQLMITTDVENYPGFPEGILGPDLVEQMRKQAERFETRFVEDLVAKADLSKRPFALTLESSGETVTCDAVIIATGAVAKWIGLPAERQLMGFGVSACATCDGAFFKNQDIAVVGGGDTAMEEASFLTRFARKVYVVHRRGELRASKIMQKRVLENPKVEMIWHHEVIDVMGDVPKPGVTGLKLRDVRDQKTRELAVTGLFVAIGHQPNTDLFKGQLAMDDAGYLVLEKGSATRIPGVFAAGDVADHTYRQAVTAAGSGCMAAIDAERFLAHA